MLTFKDPRTVARDIPGIFDILFPQLVPGIVAHFNRKTVSLRTCQTLPEKFVMASSLNRAMLFEVAFARAEQLIAGLEHANWDSCLITAVERQRQYFDAVMPEVLTQPDEIVAEWVAKNLFSMLSYIQTKTGEHSVIRSPVIPGYQWIASGYGDFSLGTRIIEVKCTNKHFSASDYRQILMYWLLSYASSIEKSTFEWTTGFLINPRLNYLLELSFSEIVPVLGAGRSSVEILELFSSLIGEHTLRMLKSINE